LIKNQGRITVTSFEEQAEELMREHPDEVRAMAHSDNKYEAAMAQIIIDTVGETD
jgi:hypothetical protein